MAYLIGLLLTALAAVSHSLGWFEGIELKLYDLEVDQSEWKDLAKDKPEVAAEAAALMTAAHTTSVHPMWLLDHEKPKKG